MLRVCHILCHLSFIEPSWKRWWSPNFVRETQGLHCMTVNKWKVANWNFQVQCFLWLASDSLTRWILSLVIPVLGRVKLCPPFFIFYTIENTSCDGRREIAGLLRVQFCLLKLISTWKWKHHQIQLLFVFMCSFFISPFMLRGTLSQVRREWAVSQWELLAGFISP